MILTLSRTGSSGWPCPERSSSSMDLASPSEKTERSWPLVRTVSSVVMWTTFSMFASICGPSGRAAYTVYTPDSSRMRLINGVSCSLPRYAVQRDRRRTIRETMGSDGLRFPNLRSFSQSDHPPVMETWNRVSSGRPRNGDRSAPRRAMSSWGRQRKERILARSMTSCLPNSPVPAWTWKGIPYCERAAVQAGRCVRRARRMAMSPYPAGLGVIPPIPSGSHTIGRSFSARTWIRRATASDSASWDFIPSRSGTARTSTPPVVF